MTRKPQSKGPGWHKDNKRHSIAAKMGWQNRRAGMKPSHTPAELRRIHEERSKRSRVQDERQTAKRLLDPEDPYTDSWVKDPGQMDIRGIDALIQEREEKKKNIYSKEYRDSWRERVPEDLEEGDTITFTHGKTGVELKGKVLNYRQDGRVLDILTEDGEQYTVKATRGTITRTKKRTREKTPWNKTPIPFFDGYMLTPGDVISKYEGGPQYKVRMVHTLGSERTDWQWDVVNTTTGEEEIFTFRQAGNHRFVEVGPITSAIREKEEAARNATTTKELDEIETWRKEQKGGGNKLYEIVKWHVDQQRRVLADRAEKERKEKRKRERAEQAFIENEKRKQRIEKEMAEYRPAVTKARDDLESINSDLKTVKSYKNLDALRNRLGSVSASLRKKTPLGINKEFAEWSNIDDDMERTGALLAHKRMDMSADNKAKRGSRSGKTYMSEAYKKFKSPNSKKGIKLSGWPAFGAPEMNPVIDPNHTRMIVSRENIDNNKSFKSSFEYAKEDTPYQVTGIEPVGDSIVRIRFKDKKWGAQGKVDASAQLFYDAKAMAGPDAKVYPTDDDMPFFIEGKNGAVLIAPRIE